MLRPFSCWHNARHHGTSSMLKPIIGILLLSSALLAQTSPTTDAIKKDVQTLQNAANDSIGGTVSPLGVLQVARGTFLDGYGIVVTMEVALEPPRNPFAAIKTSDEVRTVVAQKRKAMTDKLMNLLKEKVPALGSIASNESATIIVYLLNANPADLPDMPAQLVFTLRKEDAEAGSVKLIEYR